MRGPYGPGGRPLCKTRWWGGGAAPARARLSPGPDLWGNSGPSSSRVRLQLWWVPRTQTTHPKCSPPVTKVGRPGTATLPAAPATQEPWSAPATGAGKGAREAQMPGGAGLAQGALWTSGGGLGRPASPTTALLPLTPLLGPWFPQRLLPAEGLRVIDQRLVAGGEDTQADPAGTG